MGDSRHIGGRFANTDTHTSPTYASHGGATEPIAAPPSELPRELARSAAPLHGGPLALLRFMRRNGMLNLKYARLLRAARAPGSCACAGA